MTAEERATKLLDEHQIEYAVGYKHHSPAKALEVIASAIRAAEAEMKERCVRVADWTFDVYGCHSVIADRIRALEEK